VLWLMKFLGGSLDGLDWHCMATDKGKGVFHFVGRINYHRRYTTSYQKSVLLDIRN
jgi:hypothetical protein